MGVPKRKTSKSKRRMRQRSHKKAIVTAQVCPKCGAPQMSHRVCPACGTYRGRQVLIITADE
ncbi:MAG: 50S ribosomal protein L32 [Kiritimatiellae bacterium]|nr:50S ribosomal protein L32 [Kiritimatiellia bacterium]